MYKYTLTFPDYSFYNKVSVIKGIRMLTGLGLKEAKDASESGSPFVHITPFPMEQETRVQLSGNGVKIVEGTDADQSVEDLLKAAATITLADGEIARTIAILQLI